MNCGSGDAGLLGGSAVQDGSPRIAVVGDIMIDIDHHCSATRLSQDGPWPVFTIQHTERRLGGAGNVAAMCRALGADVLLCGLVHVDDLDEVADLSGTIRQGWRGCMSPTTRKARFVVDGRYAGLRVDQDCHERIGREDAERFVEDLQSFRPHRLLICDHGKGVVTSALMSAVSRLDAPVYCDPQPTTDVSSVSHALMVGHAREMPRQSWSQDRIIKLGADGLTWTIGREAGSLPSACRRLVDPLGAGDQFLAALAVRRCLGDDWRSAIDWANHAAGLQCERPGCVPVTLDDLVQSTTANVS